MAGQNGDDGYSRLSIFLHWITAIAVVALFLTHEGERGSLQYAFHVGGGAVAGLILIWRVLHRARRGMTAKPDQLMILNLLSQIVMWGFLAAILVVVVSGYLLPWSLGQPLDVFGLPIPSPISRNPGLHELVEEIHDAAGHAFVPLLVLHLLGVAKHAFVDRDGIARRMFSTVAGGR